MSTQKIWHLALLVFAIPAIAQVEVLTSQYDNMRTGANSQETILTPSNVVYTTFGKLFTHSVDGIIVGQALYLPGVSIPGKGTHNVVYVATMNDTVYAFDADSASGSNASPLWQTRVLPSGATPVPISVQGGGGITGWTQVGVVSTPVIDSTAGILYVIAKDYLQGVATHRIHGLNVATGAEKFTPVAISASFTSGGKTYVFNNLTEVNRPALLLANGILYIAFGSNGGNGSEQGWVLAYSAATPGSIPKFRGAFNDEPGTCCGAIWQTGGGLSADSAGAVYAVSGDGLFAAGTRLGESAFKLQLTSSGLQLADWFTPYNWNFLWQHDGDLEMSALLLPNQSGPHPYLAITSGKTGVIYVLNRNNMGRLCTSCTGGDTQIVQEINAFPSLGGNPQNFAYFNGTVYTFPPGYPLASWTLSGGLLPLTPTHQSQMAGAWHSGIISANGTSNAILWVLTGYSYVAQLQAFNAVTLQRIYSARQAGTRDLLPNAAHFAKLMEAHGRVYVGTDTSFVAFGPL